MGTTRRLTSIVVVTIAIGLVAAPAFAQVASALVKEGDVVDSNGFPGHVVTVVQTPAKNGIGGWAVGITTSDGATTLSHGYGSTNGIAPPRILGSETTVGSLVQTSWETRIGVSDTGSLCYSASGTGGPDGSFDSAWVDLTPIAVEGDPLPPGPHSDLYWSFASAPTMTANGIPIFSGGTRDTVSGSTTARGLFNDTGTPILFCGDLVPGAPDVLDCGDTFDFDFKVSAYGNQYLINLAMVTTGVVGFSEDNIVVKSGETLYIDGMIVQEEHPIPASIGGQAGEEWDNFDYMGINEVGEYIFTGDSINGAGGTTQDEFVVVNGQIVAREGFMLDGKAVNGAIEDADMNESGDWAVVWDIDDPSNIEALFFNGQFVIAEGAEVDLDGDGVIDLGTSITDFNGLSGGVKVGNRDANGDVAIYFAADVNNEFGNNLSTLLRVIMPTTPGSDGDLEIHVTDAPDPLTIIPGDITYTVAVRNNSPNPATGVQVVSNLDPSLVFNPAASDPIAVHSAGVVTASIGNMAPYQVFSYHFAATASTGPTVTTTSSVSGNETDTVPGNNDASNDTVVALITDLSLTITDSPDPVRDSAEPITYTVEVANAGPSDATGVVVTMNLDPTSVFNAALSDPIASHSAGVVTANIGPLNAGASTAFDVVVDTTVQTLLTVDASVTGNEIDPDLANNAYVEDTLYELLRDLAIAIVDTPDPVVPVGGQISYDVTVSNGGPSDATGVAASVTLDDSTSIVSVTPPATHDGSPTGGVVSFNVGPLTTGDIATIGIVVDTLSAGRPMAIGSVEGGPDETEADPANNLAIVHTLVRNDAVGLSIGVFSTISGHPTENVPDLPGVFFTLGCDKPARSPNGKLWITSCETTADEVIIVGDQCSASTMVQENVSTIGVVGDHVGAIDSDISINDSGQFVFATNTDNTTTADEVIARWSGTALTAIAREGDFAAPTTFKYSFTLFAPRILQNGQVWFMGDTDNPDTTKDYYLFEKNGNTTRLQEGVSIPTGQAGGAMSPWDNFDTEDFWIDAAGLNYIVQGDTEDDISFDDILAFNNNVVVQEGIVLAGSSFTSPTSLVDYSGVSPLGDWFARGDNADGQDWVLENGAVLAATDDSIVGGPEQYDDAPYSACFFLFASNNAGDYILGATTNAGEDSSNAVLVLNGNTIISREDDPIDLDGNGVIDDPVRIRTYGNDDLILTEDLQAYFTVTMRDINDSGSNTDVGDAYLRLNLCGVATQCGDLDNDKDVDGDDYSLFLAAYGHGTCDADYHVCADFDEDGIVTAVDYQQWLLCYRDFIGNPNAPAPAVDGGTGPTPVDPIDDPTVEPLHPSVRPAADRKPIGQP